MTVTRSELEKLAEISGWRNKDSTISRILEQSKKLSSNRKNAVNYGRHLEGTINKKIENINGLSDMVILSTGTLHNTLKDGEVIDINVDKMMLEEICQTMSSYGSKVYVGHQMTHDNHIGYLSNLRVDGDETGRYHLKGTVLYPQGGVDMKLQKGVIDGIKNNKIKDISAGLAFTASTLSDNNDYITNMYIPEVSIIPPLGFKLEDDDGIKSTNNMVPLSDAHIVNFAFSQGKLEIFENDSHQVLMNVNGVAIGNVNASYLSKMLVDIGKDGDFIDETDFENIPDDIDISTYEKLGEFQLDKIRDGEFKILGLKREVFLKMNSNSFSLSTTPHSVRYINKLALNLTETERKYIK